MNKTAKIIVTIVIAFIFFILFGAIVGVRSDAGRNTPGILGLIVFAGAFGAIRAIWKKDKNKNENTDKNITDNEHEDDSSILQK